MKKKLLSCLILSFVLPAIVYAANGTFVITGNTLVFPDGSTVSTAPKDGKSMLSGSGAPTGIVGNIGDMYIDTLNKMLYGPYFGSWGSGVSISGLNGLNSLVLQTVEPAGSNCTSGGIKIQSGLDLNRDNVLEPNEVQQENYVCNVANQVINLTGTYTGTQFNANSATISQAPVLPISESIAIVMNQTGTSITGTFVSDSGGAGVISGTLLGNLLTFTATNNAFIPTFNVSGCDITTTSTQENGTGTIVNNTITILFSSRYGFDVNCPDTPASSGVVNGFGTSILIKQ